MNTTDDVRRRGAALIVMLSVLTFAQTIGLIVVFTAWRDAVDHDRDGQAVLVAAMVSGVLALVALGGLWALQRWAVYLFALVAAFGLISDLVLGLPTQAILVRLAILAGVAVTVSRCWDSLR